MVKRYTVRLFLEDLMSGVTVSVVLLPQAIAYAGLAHIPPIQALISSFYVLVLYLVFGSSVGLAVGPEASVSIITGLTIETELASNLSSYDASQVASVLALLAGVAAIVMALLRAGFVDQILSGYLLTGFVLGVSNLIIIEQMPGLLGLPPTIFGGDDSTIIKLVKVIQHVPNAVWRSVVVSISNIGFLLAAKWLKRRFFRGNVIVNRIPEILVLVVIMIAVSAGINLKSTGVAVLGTFENTIPKPSAPPMDFELFVRMLEPAVVILLVGFIECQTVTRNFGLKHGHVPSGNKELFAFGIANFISAFFGTMPIFASLPRSRILGNTHPHTTLANAMGGVLVLLFSQVLVPVLQYLPKPTLASIVTVAALGLIEVKEMKFAVRLRSWVEIAMLICTYVITLVTTISTGILICLALSALLIVRKTTTSTMSVMGRVPTVNAAPTTGHGLDTIVEVSNRDDDTQHSPLEARQVDEQHHRQPHHHHHHHHTDHRHTLATMRFVNLDEHPDAELLDGVLLLRVDVPIMFYNCGQVRHTIESMMKIESRVLSERPPSIGGDTASFNSEGGDGTTAVNQDSVTTMTRLSPAAGGQLLLDERKRRRSETEARLKLNRSKQNLKGDNVDVELGAPKRLDPDFIDDEDDVGLSTSRFTALETDEPELGDGAFSALAHRRSSFRLSLAEAEVDGVSGVSGALKRMAEDGFHTIVFDLKSSFSMDSAATFVFKKIIGTFLAKGVDVFICGLHDFQRDLFTRADMGKMIEGRCFETMADAVIHIEKGLDKVEWRMA
ncbi:sulfate transporter family-domain-containing protein [Zopfochytrium polystomum]|nr:sulfate transporter family-domain-containing protein [Zopfochytrium polystomum]